MPIMNKQTINPGDVYMVNGMLCMVTHIVTKRVYVLWDDGSAGNLQLHQLYEGVPHGSAADYLQPLLNALKAIGSGQDADPLYNDDEMHRAHRTGMLLGAISTCDDIYAKLLQLGKGDASPSFQDAMRAVEGYIKGVQHLGIKDGIATETSENNVIKLNKGGVQ